MKLLRFVSRGMQAWIQWNKANHDRVHEQLRRDFPDYEERIKRPGSLGERFPEAFPAPPRGWHRRPGEGDDQS